VTGRVVGERLVHAMVGPVPGKPWEREWITLHAETLDQAVERAKEYFGVVRVYEVCWDPGYVT
jgi:hypothetical protein